MNIGFDIDNVITYFDKEILSEFKKQDKKKRNNGIINKNAQHINYGMFDWSKEEVDEFYNDNMERIAQNLKVQRRCKYYLKKLKKLGHKIFLITHRAYPHYTRPKKTTKDWLTIQNIPYTKLVISKSPDKTEECKNLNIDIMFDDREDQCEKMRNNGINCVLKLTKYNYRYKKDLPHVKTWKDIYKMIINKAKNK